MWRRNACFSEVTVAGISLPVGELGTDSPGTTILQVGASMKVQAPGRF